MIVKTKPEPLPTVIDRELVERLLTELVRINEKLDSLIGYNFELHREFMARFVRSDQDKKTPRVQADVMSLLDLPMALRKTAVELYKVDRATADELAEMTGRLRAVESNAANQLVRMGYVKKSKLGRKTYFFIEPSEEDT